MNKQESALELTERDIENAFIQQENAAVARELSESDEWVNGDAIYVDHEFEGYLVGKSRNGWLVVEHPDKPDYTNVNPDMAIKGLSPDQLAAKELFELSFESANLSGVKAPCVYEWGRLSEKEKNYWVIFSEAINFKRDK